ncbi:conserved hypothetical protein [Streptomyces pristinaespiralis ATCC 25486]|uniref:ChsH2 rubredoxin-like zinc ribbon domain-containing protein n=1 Tax=Streptomyces pristinaespiralis (strain ATCC 25486 / DSM 40338 / CBS 914.69 / JCM 4507 / KCC S-0507 / NBRC 13074 / NRRL 2958 / 5647) TaxID=457429 RepID=B5H6R4_STRE2|nr:conserved hypothetical protein [Streptomyces pristinaespiralis ATCC 25486]
MWKGELHFQRCTWCRTAIFRRLLCPACASTDLTTERSSGIGTIHHVSIMGRNVGRPWALATIRMREEFSIRAKVLDVYRAHVGAVVCLDSGMEAGSQQISFRPYDAPARAKSAPTRK